jgi:DnaD/phage-associated family protein
MAKFRAIYRSIWKDPAFQLYSPEGKLLFIYLCTCESTTESGIYPITQPTMSNETGISLPTVTKLLDNGLRNVTYDIDNYCVFVKRFRIYNAGGKPDLIKKSILHDFNVTPRTKLWEEFIKLYPIYAEDLLNLMKQFTNGCPTISASGSGSCSGNNISIGISNGSANIPQQQNLKEDTVFKIYQDNFGLIHSPILVDELKDIAKTYPDGWFEDATKEAFKSASGKPNLKYITAILERWTRDGKNNGNNTYHQDTKLDPNHPTKSTRYKYVN